MRYSSSSTAALFCLAAFSASSALGQNRGVATAHPGAVSGLHFNNPYTQPGVYNNTPGLFYNSPYNQAGMYNNAPGLFYNNPYTQAGVYNNTPGLFYNNPYNQAGMYNNAPGLFYNNPFNQFGMYNNSPALHFNNPYTQAGIYNNAAGLYYNNGFNQAGMYNNSAALRYNNPGNQAGMYNGAALNFNNSSNQSGLNGGLPATNYFSGTVGASSGVLGVGALRVERHCGRPWSQCRRHRHQRGFGRHRGQCRRCRINQGGHAERTAFTGDQRQPNSRSGLGQRGDKRAIRSGCCDQQRLGGPGRGLRNCSFPLPSHDSSLIVSRAQSVPPRFVPGMSRRTQSHEARLAELGSLSL